MPPRPRRRQRLVAERLEPRRLLAADTPLSTALEATELVGPANGLARAVVGELVTYRATLTLPEGTLGGVRLGVTFEAPLVYVDLPVAPAPGGAVSFSGNAAPVVSPGGRGVSFELGTVTNADRDAATAETISFVFRAAVTDTEAARGGARLRALATASWDGLTTPWRAATPGVTVIEPQPVLTAAAAFAAGGETGAAGDAVVWTFTLRNPPGAPLFTTDAYDAALSIPLARVAGGSLVDGPSFSVADSAGMVTAADFELVGSAAAGWTIRTRRGRAFDLPVDADRTVAVTVRGTLGTRAKAGTVLRTTATATWTTLEGAPGPRSAFDASAKQRTGNGGVDDLVRTASADLRIRDLGGTLAVVATSENATADPGRVVAGEVVRLRAVVTVPEGEIAADSARLAVALPPGLRFLADGTARAALVSNGGLTAGTFPGGAAAVPGTTAAGVTPTQPIPAAALLGAPFGSGGDVTFDFGRLVNTDQDAGGEFIVAEFNVLVENVAGNGVSTGVGNDLVVEAGVVLDGERLMIGSTAVMTVAEGRLAGLTLTAVADDDRTTVAGPFAAGDRVRQRVEFAASAGAERAALHDVQVADPLPTGLVLVPGSVRVLVNNAVAVDAADTSSAGRLLVTLPRLAPGDAVRVLYDVTLAAPLPAGTALERSVEVTATSLPGAGTAPNATGSTVPGPAGSATGERTGADGPGGVPNRLALRATAALAIRGQAPASGPATVALVTTITNGQATYRPGGPATYTVIVTNAGPDTARDARVTVPLPAGLTAATWSARYAPGAAGPGAGSGGIDAAVTLPAGGAAIFTLAATVAADALAALAVTAGVVAAAGVDEPNTADNTATDVDRPTLIITGSDVGATSAPWVTVLDVGGAVRARFLAYEADFRGGVRVAVGDFDGDGSIEIATAPGPGRAAEVRVFTPDGRELPAFRLLPFAPGYASGVEIAAGDVDGDGIDDLLAAASRGPGNVAIFRSTPGAARPFTTAPTRSFRAFATSFAGGATIAAADLGTFAAGRVVDATRPDGIAEAVVGSGPGSAPLVVVFDVSGPPTPIDSFQPFTPALLGGVAVAAAPFPGEPVPAIVVAGGRGGGSATEFYEGRVGPAANRLLARQAVFTGLGRPGVPVYTVGVDLEGTGRQATFLSVQGSGGGAGVRRVAVAGVAAGTLADVAGPLRIAAAPIRAPAGFVTTASGLAYRDLVAGTGARPLPGQSVAVHYVGSLRNGAVFDASRTKGTPFRFPLGTGAVIAGWDEALATMRVGGRRQLVIPAPLGYGAAGFPPDIPGNATLVFDVELLDVGP